MEEQEEKEAKMAESQVKKAEKMLAGNKGMTDRKRGWFQSHKERTNEKGLCEISFVCDCGCNHVI